MWFHTIQKQHEEKMNLLKEQKKILGEIADALRKLIAQQTKDNIKSDCNPSKPEPIKNKKKAKKDKRGEDRCGLTQNNTNLLNSLPADHTFLDDFIY